MPRPNEVHIDVAVSGFTLDYYKALAADYIGPQVAPVFNSDKQSNLYYVTKRKSRLQDIRRAPGDVYKTVDWGYSDSAFHCKGYGASVPIPAELAANADPAMNVDMDAVSAVMDTVMINAEDRVASLIFNDAVMVYGDALEGTAKWDSSAPDPWSCRKIANASVRPKIGRKVNTMVINDDSWEILRDLTVVRERIYGEGPQGVPTIAQVAAILGLDQIFIGKASDFNEDTQEYVDLWGNYALFAYYPVSVNENMGRVTVPARTFVWNVDSVGRFQISAPVFDASRKSDIRYVDDYTDEKAVCPEAAYLFADVLGG